MTLRPPYSPASAVAAVPCGAKWAVEVSSWEMLLGTEAENEVARQVLRISKFGSFVTWGAGKEMLGAGEGKCWGLQKTNNTREMLGVSSCRMCVVRQKWRRKQRA